MKRLLLVLSAALVPVYAFAVDGQVLINMSTVLAAGGFPFRINQAGSYKLSGNLTVPDGNTTAIVIAHDNVTIDLNGFSIIGPVDCSAGIPCAGAGSITAHGIVAGTDSPVQPYFNITIRNGTIQGMGADGVHLLGDSILLEDLHIRSNGLSGIVVRSPGPASSTSAVIFHHNTVQLSGSYGIKAYAGLITDNTISDSFIGIIVEVGGSTVARNVVLRSHFEGLALTRSDSYFGNTLVGNNSGAAQVSGGVNLGQNLCNTAVCPGAVF
jgi:hypothetical protein